MDDEVALDHYIAEICVDLPARECLHKRFLIAIAGPPASGKSTLAAKLVETINTNDQTSATLVPMDGFHLDNETLAGRGLLERKGAPQTFDAPGFVQLAEQLRTSNRDIRYPVFDRSADAVIPDGGQVSTTTQIVVVEGNYLLLNDAPWLKLEALFDLTVFLDVSLQTLEERLINRWLLHGLSDEQAQARSLKNDIPNARYVLENSRAADLVLTTKT